MTTAAALEHTIDYEEIRRTAREFTEREIVPIADEIDQQDLDLPEPLLDKMAAAGYFGPQIPEEWGGAGLDTQSIAIITEELCRGLLSAGSVLGRNFLMGDLVWHDGTDEQKERYLRRIATGEIQTAWAGTEPEAGSDSANVQLRAVRDGDTYYLTGTKMWCTFAARANTLFVYARTDPDATPKHRGISCFMVDKTPGTQFEPPTLAGDRIPTSGYHGLKSYMLYFDNHPVPAENLLGGVENKGFYQLMKGYELARTAFSARCVGVAQAAYEAALAYSKNRVQFGKPLMDFQATRFKLAELATDVTAARQLVLHVASLRDSGKRCDLEAGMAKLFCSEVALKHTWTALQLHGGLGFSTETKVNRYWRDAALLPIGEGTNDVQKEVIARGLLGEDRRG
jgi:alkylation response protein AidB-like acyl-CoA dehydrogenase